MKILTQTYHSPCGDLLLGSIGDSLCLCNWLTRQDTTLRTARLLHAELSNTPSSITVKAATQLDEYFSLRRKAFSLPIMFVGTDFQKQVWAELLKITCGCTISYSEQALRIGRPKAVRAVAAANGANAISIIVPCHRVVGSDGRLTGYGGGIAAKSYLLEHEARVLSLFRKEGKR